jgi:hypothetical protein
MLGEGIERQGENQGAHLFNVLLHSTLTHYRKMVNVVRYGTIFRMVFTAPLWDDRTEGGEPLVLCGLVWTHGSLSRMRTGSNSVQRSSVTPHNFCNPTRISDFLVSRE